MTAAAAAVVVAVTCCVVTSDLREKFRRTPARLVLTECIRSYTLCVSSMGMTKTREQR